MWMIKYGTDSGDEGTYPFMFDKQPTKEQASDLVRSWAYWEVEDGTSYVAYVEVVSLDKPFIKDIDEHLEKQKANFEEQVGVPFSEIRRI